MHICLVAFMHAHVLHQYKYIHLHAQVYIHVPVPNHFCGRRRVQRWSSWKPELHFEATQLDHDTFALAGMIGWRRPHRRNDIHSFVRRGRIRTAQPKSRMPSMGTGGRMRFLRSGMHREHTFSHGVCAGKVLLRSKRYDMNCQPYWALCKPWCQLGLEIVQWTQLVSTLTMKWPRPSASVGPGAGSKSSRSDRRRLTISAN